MKKLSLLIAFLVYSMCTYSQQLSHVIFTGGTTFSSFVFLTDQQVLIRITDDGNIIDWGMEAVPLRYYSSIKLQPYMGRVDYYGQEYDSVLRGKVKSIGTCSINYYGSSDTKTKIGKVKSIGRTSLDYYSSYEDVAFQGKLQVAGYLLFTYYSSYENEAFKGKLKSVQNTTLTYYSTFDDKSVKGKIKRIGSYDYSWYSSYDRKELQGAMKSGVVKQNINGVTFIIM